MVAFSAKRVAIARPAVPPPIITQSKLAFSPGTQKEVPTKLMFLPRDCRGRSSKAAVEVRKKKAAMKSAAHKRVDAGCGV